MCSWLSILFCGSRLIKQGQNSLGSPLSMYFLCLPRRAAAAERSRVNVDSKVMLPGSAFSHLRDFGLLLL